MRLTKENYKTIGYGVNNELTMLQRFSKENMQNYETSC